ncbi:MAG: helix-turn-helix domain-containing protein [Sphaerochaetaceae bacterium]|nr:helix-turn-helix domain-containing protein [Sphaerochaetaceae bacterium]
MDLKQLKEELLSDDKVRQEYDALEPEYQLLSEMIKLRNELNISQQELAARTGIDRADICKLENGNGNPSLKTIKRIAKGLGKQVQIRFV